MTSIQWPPARAYRHRAGRHGRPVRPDDRGVDPADRATEVARGSSPQRSPEPGSSHRPSPATQRSGFRDYFVAPKQRTDDSHDEPKRQSHAHRACRHHPHPTCRATHRTGRGRLNQRATLADRGRRRPTPQLCGTFACRGRLDRDFPLWRCGLDVEVRRGDCRIDARRV